MATNSAEVQGNITVPVTAEVKEQMTTRRTSKRNKKGNQDTGEADTAAPATGGKGKGKRGAAAIVEDKTPAPQADGLMEAEDTGVNPWLKTATSDAGLTPGLAMSKFTRKAEKRQAKLQRQVRTSVTKEASDVMVDITKADNVQAKGGKGKAKGKGKGPNAGEIDETADGNIEDAVNATAAFDMNANATQEQKELIAQAFADDNVIDEEFEEEKAKLTDRETIKDKDVTLPGWGCWAGEGVVNDKPQKRVIIKAPKQGKRKDDGKKNVIITQRKNKKLDAKRIERVPYPFTNPHQLERSIAQPIGKEWNSVKTFEEMSTAKVSTKAGTIIQPMAITKGARVRRATFVFPAYSRRAPVSLTRGFVWMRCVSAAF